MWATPQWYDLFIEYTLLKPTISNGYILCIVQYIQVLLCYLRAVALSDPLIGTQAPPGQRVNNSSLNPLPPCMRHKGLSHSRCLINTLHCMDQLAEGKWEGKSRSLQSSETGNLLLFYYKKKKILIIHTCKHIQKIPTSTRVDSVSQTVALQDRSTFISLKCHHSKASWPCYEVS